MFAWGIFLVKWGLFFYILLVPGDFLWAGFFLALGNLITGISDKGACLLKISVRTFLVSGLAAALAYWTEMGAFTALLIVVFIDVLWQVFL